MVITDPFTTSILPLYSQISPENQGGPISRLLPVSAEKVEPLENVSNTPQHRVDESPAGWEVSFDEDNDRQRRLKEELCEKLKAMARKEGVYNSDIEFSPPPYTGLIVDIYC